MTLDRETYVAMNKAYNTLFDNWKKIEDIDRKTDQTMNMAMVLLDQALDAFKKATPPKAAPGGSSGAGAGGKKPAVEIPAGWGLVTGK
ncbi:MAG: hypothetical protein K6G80_10910 [Treponema sp.]|nr:hypothetical protein [Treponema sp.]